MCLGNEISYTRSCAVVSGTVALLVSMCPVVLLIQGGIYTSSSADAATLNSLHVARTFEITHWLSIVILDPLAVGPDHSANSSSCCSVGKDAVTSCSWIVEGLPRPMLNSLHATLVVLQRTKKGIGAVLVKDVASPPRNVPMLDILVRDVSIFTPSLAV